MAASNAGFPGRRVERVLKREGMCGRKDKILAEGPFLQLSDEGDPERQVFLGVTSAAFITVKQEIQTSIETRNLTEDLEVSDLVLSQVLPLPTVQFFIVDDRAKRFTVCTSFGYLLQYEMCQLDTNFEFAWSKWRRALIDISGKDGCILDFKSWRPFSATNTNIQNKKRNSESIIYGQNDERPFYVHRPMSFNQVRSVGVQTINTEETVAKMAAPANPANNAFGCDPIVESDDSDTLVASGTNTTLGARISDRLDIFSVQTGAWNISIVDVGEHNVLPDRCVSWTLCTNMNEEKSKPILSKHSLKMLKKKRTPMDVSYRRPEFVSDSDSDEDLDDVFGYAMSKRAEGRAKSGRDLWNTAKRLVLNKGNETSPKKSMFGKIVSMFSVEQIKKPPTSIDFLKPEDVSSELTCMFIKLLNNIRGADIDHFSESKGRRIPARLAMLLKFGDNISKMVATEVLRAKTVLDRVVVIKLFVEVCVDLLYNTRDFLSLIPVLRGLTSLPIYRLDDTWATLFVEEELTYRKFLCITKLLSPVRKYAAYSCRVRMLQSRDAAFLPWLEHFLWHCRTKRCTVELSYNEKADTHLPRPSIVLSTSKSKSKKASNMRGKTQRKGNLMYEQINNKSETGDVSNSLKPVLVNKRNRWEFCPLFEKSSKRVRFAHDVIQIDDDDQPNTSKATNSVKNLITRFNENEDKLSSIFARTDVKSKERSDADNAWDESDSLNLGQANYINKSSKRNSIDLFSEKLTRVVIADAMIDVANESLSGESDSDSGHESDKTESALENSTDDTDDTIEEMPHNLDGNLQDVNDTGDRLTGAEIHPHQQHDILGKNDKFGRAKALPEADIKTERPSYRNMESLTKTFMKQQKTQKVFNSIKNSDNLENAHDPDKDFEQEKLREMQTLKEQEDKISASPCSMTGGQQMSDPPENLFHKMMDINVSVRTPAQPRLSETRGSVATSSAGMGRRKSLFEEAVKNSDDEQDDLNVFENLKLYKLNSMKKRGSIALGLLASDEDNIDSNSLFPFQQNKSNNNKQNKTLSDKNQRRVRIETKTTKSTLSTVSKSFSSEALQFVSDTECYICGKGRCLYFPDNRKNLLHFQTSTHKIPSKSRRRVKEFIQDTVEMNSFLSEYEIMQISLSLT